MKSITRLSAFIALMVTALMSSEGECAAAAAAGELKAPLQARFFACEAVRLLDGPFQEAMLRDQAYILSLPLDRVLHTYRLQAKLPTSAQPLGGWEAPDVEIRGEFAGHYLRACALMYASTGDKRFKQRAESLVAELAKCQQALGPSGYLSAFPEAHFDRIESGRPAWAPWYVIHKILAGLLDVASHCRSAEALEVARKLGDWATARTERLSDEQMQSMLRVEHGGMTEAMADLFAATGDAKYLRTAQRFVHRAVIDPLASQRDELDGLHGNTQIPKLIGSARLYNLTGDQRHRAAAEFFWERVSGHRSFVIGGHGDREHFFPIDSFARHLSPETAETCNTYNMLRLTRELFCWEPTARLMDFYERGLYNHILASQDPHQCGFVYLMSLKPGHFKTYCTPLDSFWCCVCTGIENHAKYTDTIYAHSDDALYVNLFLSSELTWEQKGLVVRQETRFPEHDTTRLTFHCRTPVELAVRVRCPSWAKGFTATLNGQRCDLRAEPGAYATIARTWHDGDKLDLRLPMDLHTEPLPDVADTVAIMFGPLVLAGELGTEGMPSPYAKRQTEQVHVPSPRVPALVSDSPDFLERIRTVDGRPLAFRTEGLGKPYDVTLVPFYQLHHQRYSVYWKTISSKQWPQYNADAEAAEAAARELARCTTDQVYPGEPQSDQDHQMKGEHTGVASMTDHKCRFAAPGGWFSYVLRVVPDQPLAVICTYWGDDTGRRQFDILVGDTPVATEKLVKSHPGEFFDVRYPIPADLTRGKTEIVVRFQGHSGNTAGGVFGIRMVRSEATNSAIQADGTRPQLYNVAVDPAESRNLADSQPEVVRRLRTLVLDWNAALPK